MTTPLHDLTRKIAYTLFVAALTLCCANCLAAEEAEPPKPAPEADEEAGWPKVNVSAGIDVVTNYVFRGFDYLDDKPAIQPWAGVAFPDAGVEIGLWTSFAASDREDEEIRALDEFDITVSWGHTWWLFNFGAGHVAYILPDSPGHAGYSAELFAWFGVGFEPIPGTLALGAGLTGYWDYDQGNDLYMSVAADATWTAMDFGAGTLVIGAGATAGYNHGQYNVDPGLSDIDLRGSVTVNVWLLSLYVECHAVLIPEETVNDEDEEVWLKAGVSISF